jgi:hypothetical protein
MLFHDVWMEYFPKDPSRASLFEWLMPMASRDEMRASRWTQSR